MSHFVFSSSENVLLPGLFITDSKTQSKQTERETEKGQSEIRQRENERYIR